MPADTGRSTLNRRASSRKPIQLRVDVVPVLDHVGAPSSAPTRRGVTLDVSASGLLCSRVGYLPLGSLVRLFVGLPDRTTSPLACYARVVRCDAPEARRLRSSGLGWATGVGCTCARPGYGLKLIGIGLTDARRIGRLVAAARG